MITDRERQFLRYWEQNREKESTFLNKLMKGLPMAIMFGLPIILSLIVVRLFFPEWYTKISQTTPGMIITALIAVIGIVLFYSYFRMHYKWEMNDQFYKEVKAKEEKESKETDTSTIK